MKPALIVHGGAWDWADEKDAPKSEAIREALRVGYAILQDGGSALDATEKAVNVLEDSPLFDAGIGSHLNADGVVEMDALMIDGTAHNFGAVAGVKTTRYAITLARKVMTDTAHNFIVGDGADRLAKQWGLEQLPNLAFVTDEELEAFRNDIKQDGADTVGALALDINGNIASATSTGGTPMKLAGRVGDSPIFGAGGYADSDFGGACATGRGEHSMRVLLSKYVVDCMMQGNDAQAASEKAMTYVESLITDSMVATISLDKHGNLGAWHTTPKLACGWIDADGNLQVTMKNGLKITGAS